MTEREDLIKEFAPISLGRRQPQVTLTEIIMALEAPGFRSEDLDPTMAVIHLNSIKNLLQELTERSLSLLQSPERYEFTDITIAGLLKEAQDLL
jgi:hypothetical protein